MVDNNIKGIIYKVTRKSNGKTYIGQTVRSLDERIAEHIRKSNSAVGKALNKYGKESFNIEIIDEANNIDELNKREIEWIQYYGCVSPFGYNLCYGGGNTIGYNHTKESRKLMSEKRGRYFKKENPFYGKTHSFEQRKKWSEERKGRDMSRVTKASSEVRRKQVLNLDTGEVFDSVKEAAEKYGLKATHISRVCVGKRKRTGGFRWTYYKEHLKKERNITEQLTLFA